MKEVNNGGDGFLEINPATPPPRSIADGEVVRIFNDRGEMKVRARLTESMKPGVVNCYQGGWDTIQVKHYIEGHPEQLDPPDRQTRPDNHPELPVQRRVLRLSSFKSSSGADRHDCKNNTSLTT